MSEQEEFAIKFGKWLHQYCDPSDKDDLWVYYDGKKKYNYHTHELLKIFKDEQQLF